MDTISEQEFKRLCDDVYRDREEIYRLLPNVSHREALLWMLLGSLVALLSVSVEEQQGVDDHLSPDPYGDAILEILRERTTHVFDPKVYLAELSEKLSAEI